MATTSAWAVGSLVEVTRFLPSARISSPRTTIAPNGPPSPARIYSPESSTARRMKSCALFMTRIGLPPGICRTGRQAGRGGSPPSGREAGRPRRRRWRRAPSGHLGQADGAGEASERRLAMPALAQPAEEGRPLAFAADEAEKRKIAALQHLIADIEIGGMTVGHHQKEAARGRCRNIMAGGGGAFGLDIGGQYGGNISARPSIQRTRKGKSSSTCTSACPTWPAPKR